MTGTNMAPKISPTAPGRNGFKYQARYGVLVVCVDEAHQREVYEQLLLTGLKLKVVAV